MPTPSPVRIGNVEVLPLQDCSVLMNPHQFMPAYGDQFMAEWGHEADSRGLLGMSITSYLVRSGGKNVLIGTGLGGRRREGFPRGRLDETLAEAGVSPDSIDTVIHTHLHIDHVGWNTVDNDDGSKRLFFPKARFLIQRVEWEHWMQPKFLDDPASAHLAENVAPLKELAEVSLISADEEKAIDENLTFISTPGHTPGHVAVGIYSAGERAVIIGDASHHPVQLLHPDWSPSFDTDPVQSARSRDRLMEDAVADGRTWIAGHWMYPGIGRIVRLEGKRVFQAL